MEVKNIIQTCGACPSQWEGKLVDGRMFYARYRHGSLAIELSKDITDDVYDAIGGELIYHETLGDPYDGVLDQSELIDKMEESGFIFR